MEIKLGKVSIKVSTIAWVFIMVVVGGAIGQGGGVIIAVILYFLLRDKIAVAWDRYFGKKPDTE